ncbi:fungal hydrophobin [Paecilomyces variotii]|nr:fungal hydrophobin [Paecilomyces variotii]
MHSILLALFTLLPLSFARAGAQADPVIKCASGSALCCGTIGTVSDPSIVKTLNRNGIPIKEATGLLGLDCDPLYTLSGCTDHPLCCDASTDNDILYTNCAIIDPTTI